MATKYWRGLAAAVAQVGTVAITAGDAATTYRLLINGLIIASFTGNATPNTIAAGLVTAWNASVHPYKLGIVASGATTPLTLTGPAGMPFTVTTAVSGGAGTIGAYTAVTAATGPNFFDNVLNWSDSVVPVSTDTVIFRDNAINLCWNIDQNAIDLTALNIEQSYTGRIGLPIGSVAQSADGLTAAAGVQEYRTTYFRIGWTTGRIGEHSGPGTPNGSPRLKLWNDAAGASNTNIINTAAQGADSGLPAVRLKANVNSANVLVRLAPGGVGLAADEAAETATFGAISIADTSELSRVYAGDGLTVTSWTQTGGQNRLKAAATITSVEAEGGTLTLDGTMACTTVNANGGTIISNNVPAAGAAIVTANIAGGTLDMAQSTAPRTITTLNPNLGVFKADKDVVTITTLAQPAGPYAMTIT